MLREKLIDIALKWEEEYYVAPSITCAISEYDAKKAAVKQLKKEKKKVNVIEEQNKTAVTRGHDFILEVEGHQVKYQVKGSRPSDNNKKVTKVSPARVDNSKHWDILIWVLYDQNYTIQKIVSWTYKKYKKKFKDKIENNRIIKRISNKEMLEGEIMYSIN